MGKVAAGLVVFRRVAEKIEYLLLQTSYGIHHWTPPKGHVDPGESDIETAYRETVEEAGLQESDLKVFEDTKTTLNYEVKGKPKIVHYWLAELINPSAQVKLSHEHQDLRWLGLKEACELAGYADMQQVLVNYDNYLKKNN
ncbi:bis(5'-nucleosyl)-tetraphosphatase [asymmetrical] [Anthonomus grandis grandis]|uniref:bis(5'-nucleosyl)-tetraphosphatase [asymmetrical] n=1 Tax=Anthonomus grandis grandis TaxID=2921223 RepID=UPI002165F6C7|nr:bis(5'-nucleosyl)-tetraphosphatase [asymmetrical] [Anthonomus grandis grandis]XP_050295336.1 bis(5'-nucleosyl)-tetraphosphatase [asymmetrical] [Anthonomus grandis grandis]